MKKESPSTQYWLVVGSPEHWQVAFENGNVWGLQAIKKRWWERITEGDGLVFYVTRPVGGAIGLGRVITKFKQDKPLWPVEIQKGEVLWPLRFEFDVEFCFPPAQWETSRLEIDSLKAIVQAGFQPLKDKGREVALQAFEQLTRPPVAEKANLTGLHEELKAKIAEMGRIQKFLAEVEYPMEATRLDVVWRRVEKSVPTYVFEIQVGGDIYHALAKLKHAYDLWNSRIFLVAGPGERSKADALLSGTFHEIRGRITFIEIEKMQELYSKKIAYRDLEENVGIL
ncbi:MAG: EVE domain-containing protein [Acidobacteria bacterium]|nr:EVE domain-containing protein [Acidobacteriota bacterium]